MCKEWLRPNILFLAVLDRKPVETCGKRGTSPNPGTVLHRKLWEGIRSEFWETSIACFPFFFFLTRLTGPRRSLSIKLSATRVYEPQIRARLGTTAPFIMWFASNAGESGLEVTSPPRVQTWPQGVVPVECLGLR